MEINYIMASEEKTKHTRGQVAGSERTALYLVTQVGWHARRNKSTGTRLRPRAARAALNTEAQLVPLTRHPVSSLCLDFPELTAAASPHPRICG